MFSLLGLPTRWLCWRIIVLVSVTRWFCSAQINYNQECMKAIREIGTPRQWRSETNITHPLNDNYITTQVMKIPSNMDAPGHVEESSRPVLTFESQPLLSCLGPESPQLLQIIREKYLDYPDSQPYNLSVSMQDFIRDPNINMDTLALEVDNLIFKGKLKNGFFIEAGAENFETKSTTLHFEVNHGWTGLLVEPIDYYYLQGKEKRRKAISALVCLSPVSRPSIVDFSLAVASTNLRPAEDVKGFVQCFPLYSLLLSVGNPTVNYFSLDIEGGEFQVLKTIPWEKVDIQVISIETHFLGIRSPGTLRDLINYLDTVGYRHIPNAHKWREEDIFYDPFASMVKRKIENDLFVKHNLFCKMDSNKCA